MSNFKKCSKQLEKFAEVKMPTVKMVLVFDHEDVLDTPNEDLFSSIKKLNPNELTEEEVDMMYPQHVVWALVLNKQ